MGVAACANRSLFGRSIPTNDVAVASIVLLWGIAHGVAPVLQRPSIEILDHVREWIAGRDSP